MNWFVSALITGVVAFSATNIDDIVFLTIVFSQASRRWHVVIGQYLGFTALVLVSLIGFFGGQVLPHEWLRLFGVAPIAIGIKKLFAKRDEHIKFGTTGTLDVATVTFVNGADNIGIYTPLFAISDAASHNGTSRSSLCASGCVVRCWLSDSSAKSGGLYSEPMGTLDRPCGSYCPRNLHPVRLRISNCTTT